MSLLVINGNEESVVYDNQYHGQYFGQYLNNDGFEESVVYDNPPKILPNTNLISKNQYYGQYLNNDGFEGFQVKPLTRTVGFYGQYSNLEVNAYILLDTAIREFGICPIIPLEPVKIPKTEFFDFDNASIPFRSKFMFFISNGYVPDRYKDVNMFD